ncbi:MAG: 1-hydroxycarotenoid 3,4-desaturase CrtD [Pseudomonadota bacterium]
MPDGASAPPLRPRGRVAVVGAGIGGLVAALELAHQGLDVRVFEAASGPGGKMRAVPSDAGEIDAGPTVFTQPQVFEALFDAVGESLDAVLPTETAEVLARHVWPDGARLDLFADAARSEAAVEAFAGPAEAARFAAFAQRCRRLYRAFEGPMMEAEAPSALSIAAAVAPRALSLTRDMAPWTSLWGALGGAFGDARLRQLFARYATYVGGSPMRSPALLMLIAWSEAAGVRKVRGGMRRLAGALATLAEARGAAFRYDAPAARILVEGGRASGLQLASGERIAADAVVFNGDPAALGGGLLGTEASGAAPGLRRRDRSLSAWVWHFAGQPSGVPLSHHTVFFSDDYAAEFASLDRDRRPPGDPTIYVCAQDRSAADRAQPCGPGAPERLLMILNAPADGDLGPPSPQEMERCTSAAFERLRASGLTLSPPRADPTTLTTPDRFATLFPGAGGAIYGASPHGMTASLRRPTARSALPGLYLAGGGCHPGPGVPMAARSGRRAAAAIWADLGSTSPSRRAATRGGISTGSATTASAR